LKFTRLFFIFSAILLACSDLCSGFDQVTVTGNRVNIRAVADLQGEIVGQVTRGDVLSATGESQAGMIEIVPPVSVAVWVYGELIRDGEVAASSVRVRSGPGIGFRSVGKLSKGFKVEALATKGDWLRIVPPPSCRVWISREFLGGGAVQQIVVAEPPVEADVQVDSAPIEPIIRPVVAKKTVPVSKKPQPIVIRKPPAPVNALRKPNHAMVVQSKPEIRQALRVEIKDSVITTKPVVKDSELLVPDVVQKLKLVARATQGKPIVVSGKICPAGFFPLRRPSRYRLLMTSGSSPAKTGCYLIGANDKFSSFSGENVRIVGKKYWVQGVREPVIFVSELCIAE